MYRTLALSAVEAGASTSRARRAARTAALVLRFATLGVNQLGGSSSRKSNFWPIFCRVSGFERRANHTGGHELVKPV
jgi:hypothetical protein